MISPWLVFVCLLLAGAGMTVRLRAPSEAERSAFRKGQFRDLQGGKRLALGLPLDLNDAASEDLCSLPGIGPMRSEAILSHRALHGDYRSVDELVRVHGIAAKTLARLRPFLFVRRSAAPAPTDQHVAQDSKPGSK